MKKRLLALILSLTMIFTMSAVNLSAMAATEHKITLESVEAESGEDISIKVMIENNPGVWGMDLKVSYDRSALTLTSVDNGDFYQASEWTKGNLNADVYILSYEAGGFDNITTQSGTLATLNFKVSDTAVAGDYAVTASYNAGDIINVSFEDIPFTITDGKVTVKGKTVSATGVTIDETLSLKTGETKTPGYAVNPAEASNKTVSFKSNNAAVATVNETTGEVTGVKEGTATITITTADGNFTDTCVVTVSCSHTNKTSVAGKTSDCKNQGWDAYVKCDDCGQLFAENGTTEITEIPFRPLSQQHTGGTATCTKQAVCTVCNQPYGDLASHSYTAAEKKTEALKIAGNCRDKAVYWYSCSACGKVENNDSHTFLGDKVASAHIGGTTTVNAAEPNHETQIDGYTGDTKCNGCGEILSYGQSIPAGAHTPANVWSNDGEYHWKECTVVGCGIVIDGSKAAHSSTGDNIATCQTKAVCDVCNVTYGDYADHDWNTSSWEKDASGHWHKCNTAGCAEKNAFAGHTPDHQGGATEEYAIKCSLCEYEIEAQLGHTHAFDKEVVEEQYLASKANCTEPAKYYKSCKCGEKGSETFNYGEKLGHTEGTAWEKDATHHWHICTVAGCGVIIDTSKATHTPDHDGGATEEYAIKCSVCGYIIEAQLNHTHVFDKEVAEEQYIASKANCTVPAQYYKSCKCGEKGTETFASGEALGHTEGTEWKSDADNHWHACTVAGCGVIIDNSKAAHTPDRAEATETDAVKCSVCGYVITPALGHTHAYGTEWRSDKDSHWNECVCGDKANTAAHSDANKDGKCDVCEYEVATVTPDPDNKPDDTNKPSDDVQSPQTGDNSMMWLWVALLFVSGFGVVATTVLGKKRSVR